MTQKELVLKIFDLFTSFEGTIKKEIEDRISQLKKEGGRATYNIRRDAHLQHLQDRHDAILELQVYLIKNTDKITLDTGMKLCDILSDEFYGVDNG